MCRVRFQFETKRNEMKWNGIKLHFHNNSKFGDNAGWVHRPSLDIVEWQIHYWLQRLQLRQSAAMLLRSWMSFRSPPSMSMSPPAPSIFGYIDTNTLEFPECLRKFYDTINCISIVSNGVSVRIFDWYRVAHHFSKCRTAIRSLIFTIFPPLFE